MHGHSMGSGITQLALLALGERVRAASVWSTVRVQGFYYAALRLIYPTLWLDNDLTELQVPLMVQHARGDQTTPVENGEGIAQELVNLRKPSALHLYNSEDHLLSGADFAQAVQRDLQWFAAHAE
jgi:pimeloyl-ACP methyl ester carboxylesterase